MSPDGSSGEAPLHEDSPDGDAGGPLPTRGLAASGIRPDRVPGGPGERPALDNSEGPGANPKVVSDHGSIPINGQATPARKGRWNKIGSGPSSQPSVQARPTQGRRPMGRPALANRPSIIIREPCMAK